MLVQCQSGRVIEIQYHHYVFIPLDRQRSGAINPVTVRVRPELAATAVYVGQRIVVDNRVETIKMVRT